jgi:LuxR family maltose regulon positive regulatory protein
MAEVNVTIDGLSDTAPPLLLLTTKLYLPPARPNVVPRPHLTQRLNEGLTRKLTLVSAPAGFGKTTTLSEWIPHSPRCVTWVSLDEGDNDPTRFWTYFIAALQRLSPQLGENALAFIQSPQPPPMQLCLTTLLNEIATFSDPFVVVLDDYHIIENPALHEAVAFLLEHLPPQLHLMITTRADPALPLSRLRSREQLTELRARDLRFTPTEVAAFFNQVMGLALSPADVVALETHTEGWIAGLQLAALSMQGRDNLPDFIAAFTGSHRFILDYLTDEVLERRPRGSKNFLLRTSILNRLCGSLCDALTGDSDGQATLERLEQANLFIVPLDDHRQWYRYHHLFAEVLQARLRQYQPELLAELHRRASAWYEAHDSVAEAVQHALAAGDGLRAAGLIEQERWTLLGRGEIRTLHTWLEDLPGDILHTRPRLCLAHAWIFSLLEQAEAIEPCLIIAEHALTTVSPPESPVEIGAIRGEIAVLRAEVALTQSDITGAIDLCRHALDLLPKANFLLRGVATFFLGHAHRRGGQMMDAERAYGEAHALGLQTDNLLLALHALANLSIVQMAMGRLRQAAETSRRILHIAAERHRQNWPVAGLAYQGLGKLYYEWNELDTAARHLRQGIECGQRGGLTGLEINCRSTLAFTRQARHDPIAADEMLRQVAAMTSHPLYAAAEAMQEARLRLSQRQLEPAARWAESCGLSLDDTTCPYGQETGYLTLARLAIAQGRAAAVPDLLHRLQQAAEADRRTGSLIVILILGALARQAQGDASGALAALEAALMLAEPEGYIRTFVDEGAPLAALLREAFQRRIAPAYTAKLIAAFEDTSPPHDAEAEATPALPPPSAAASLLVEPLSERELEVLRLVADGHTNREIGEMLFVATGTVKKHLNNIFGKLSAGNRTQAIARAREIGLL